jgi:hypothetical protein
MTNTFAPNTLSGPNSNKIAHNLEVRRKCDTSNRWAKLPEPHRALVCYAASVMRTKFPEKTENELYRAESVLATSVKSRRRGTTRIWTLNVPELGLTLERSQSNVIKTWNVFWAPEGRKIATVEAETERQAIRKAPKPYNKYRGEMYAEECS